ncbi:MAG: UbiD family decarboxylase, partial [Pseudomonadales bacterium]|nr:UbiD family decarboxylase [Pseudomonadales bacterium]
MPFLSLREFIDHLEHSGELKRVNQPVSMHLEVTEICQRALKSGGPALLFEQAGDGNVPVLGNLFGRRERIATALGLDSIDELRNIG